MMDTPVPIPNTEVKHHSGDDSTLCENSTLPVPFFLPFWGFFLIVYYFIKISLFALYYQFLLMLFTCYFYISLKYSL